MRFLSQPISFGPKMLVVACALLAGCATTMPTGPSVMALPGSGKNFDQFRYDDADCRNFAMAQIGGPAAGQAASDANVNQAVAATLVGALAGAAIGGQDGAGAGAGLGLLMGSAGGAEKARQVGRGGQKHYDNAYVQCMYAKGQRVPVPANFTQRSQAPSGQYSSNTYAQPYAQSGQVSPPVVQASPPLPPPAPMRWQLPPQNAGIPPDYVAPNPPTSYTSPGQCIDCGVVEGIRENLAEARETDGRGALVGGLIGAAIGNQMGSGDGRALATLAGALAGGAIGNRAEAQGKPHNIGSFQIVVRMVDGSVRVVNQTRPPVWQLGDNVRWVNGELYPR